MACHCRHCLPIGLPRCAPHEAGFHHHGWRIGKMHLDRRRQAAYSSADARARLAANAAAAAERGSLSKPDLDSSDQLAAILTLPRTVVSFRGLPSDHSVCGAVLPVHSPVMAASRAMPTSCPKLKCVSPPVCPARWPTLASRLSSPTRTTEIRRPSLAWRWTSSSWLLPSVIRRMSRTTEFSYTPSSARPGADARL